MKHKLIFVLSMLGTFSVLFNMAVISMAVVYILSDLGSSAVTASYATVFYGIGNVMTIPLSRPFTARIGTLKLFLFCWPCFILATLIAGTATNYPIFIFYRFLQGISSGPLLVLFSSFLGTILEEKEKPLISQSTLLLFICAPILGASWGGWISYDYDWHSIFKINVVFMIILGIALYIQLRRFPSTKETQPFDVTGYISYCIGLFSLTFFITLGQELDWFRSEFMTATFIIGLIFFIFFILWSLHHPYPVFALSLLKDPIVSLALLNLWILFAIYFGMTLILSIWLTIYVRFTVLWVSVSLGVMIFSAPLLLHIMRNYFHHHKVWLPFGGAILLLGFSCFYTSNFDININLERIALSRIIAGFSFALFMPTLLFLIIHNQPPDLAPRAFTLFQITRGSASALGATIFYTIWIRRQVFYYERLGGTLTEFSPITKQFFIRAKAFGLEKVQMNPQLDEFLNAQATSLALNDCCYLMGWLTVALFVLFVISYIKRGVLCRDQA